MSLLVRVRSCRTLPLAFRCMGDVWHPWRHAGEAYPHILISVRHELPERIWGLQAGGRIWLCKRLDQVRRRCTLTHELIHLERGPVPTDPLLRAREEKTVSMLAAQRLIPLESLLDGLRWTRDQSQLADILWVDEPTLKVRMEHLDPVEVAEIEHHLEGDWLWIP